MIKTVCLILYAIFNIFIISLASSFMADEENDKKCAWSCFLFPFGGLGILLNIILALAL